VRILGEDVGLQETVDRGPRRALKTRPKGERPDAPRAVYQPPRLKLKKLRGREEEHEQEVARTIMFIMSRRRVSVIGPDDETSSIKLDRT
jgi:hypothetical protein